MRKKLFNLKNSPSQTTLRLALAFMILFTFSKCKKEQIRVQEERIIHDQKNLVSTNALPGTGGGVLMQAFYWDVPATIL